ncbi:MAG TPA: hypothetical protein VMR20_14745 [Verrucomicrobiae bacterium]|jgi:hypothetical protein|nr:hypothetical protein [Verrucomicrobiae bacterium]
MSLSSLLTMAIILTLVWGGLAGLLVLASKKEKDRNRFESRES